MTERREPTISAIPTDGRGEKARYNPQNSGGTDSPASRGAPARNSRNTPAPVSSRPVVVKSKIAPLALLLALVVAATAAYLFYLLQQTQMSLNGTQTELQQSNARIAELENRLSLSDDESTQSLAVIQATVKENTSEVRKLWGVAYDRNRNSIGELEKSVASLKQSLAKAQSALAGVDKKIKASGEDVAGELRVLSELVDAQQAAISKADQLTSANQQALSQLQAQMESLNGNLRAKVLNNEEAIKAIDAFRVQVNRDLLELKTVAQ